MYSSGKRGFNEHENIGNPTMYVKVSISKQSFGVWEKENKDSQESKISMKTDNGKKIICSGRHFID